MNHKILILLFIVGYLILGCAENKDTDQYEKEVAEKVSNILKEMTIDEKIGQMMQVNYLAFNDFSDIDKLNIGSVLWGGGPTVDDITPEGWIKMSTEILKYSENHRLGIPILLGIDAVHGHNNVDGAVIFPHNIGLGCTRNSELVEQAARITAKEVAATGIHWTFAPCAAVARDERWGRTYESFSENPDLVAELTAAAVRGYETDDLLKNDAILSCTKHYIGDGGTTYGIDRGNTESDENYLRKIHMPGYLAAIKENTSSIMISYSSWNDMKLHEHKYLITDVLKSELDFKGFVISDWAGIDHIPGDYKSDIKRSINAGIDMVMIPYGPDSQGQFNETDGFNYNTYNDFVTYMKELIEAEEIPMSRIDDAVTRVLTAKVKLNLFDRIKLPLKNVNIVGSEEHREIARKSVQQSLVLLKNENILPLSKSINKIHVTGKGADNLGMQCGGWSKSWQGEHGKLVEGGTTILEAIKSSVANKTVVEHSVNASQMEDADVVVVVVGEDPYAEMMGDRDNLELSEEDLSVINKVEQSGKPMVIILLSGRPLIINSALEKSDAFIAAWLPGTEGKGISDVLFGDVNFTGKLSFTWPSSMEQIPINIGDSVYNPLFEYGFGLTYK